MRNNARENDCKSLFFGIFSTFIACFCACLQWGVGDEMIIGANKRKFITQPQPSANPKELLRRFIACEERKKSAAKISQFNDISEIFGRYAKHMPEK